MSNRKVLPVIVTVRSADAPEEFRHAFSIAEPAETAKIAGWAWRCEFETAEPFVIDYMTKYNPDTLVEEIIERTLQVQAGGVVVAGMGFLRRAKILDALYEKLSGAHLGLWGADLGAKPVADLLLV